MELAVVTQSAVSQSQGAPLLTTASFFPENTSTIIWYSDFALSLPVAGSRSLYVYCLLSFEFSNKFPILVLPQEFLR
jgi:hypothetical protein